VTKGICYYTDAQLSESIAWAVREQIVRAAPRLPIASVSLNHWVTWPVGATGQPLMLTGMRGPLMMFRQILAGLEALTTDVAFLCEHDVLYHPSHFEFEPLKREPEMVFYNEYVYKVRASDGHAVTYWCNQGSGLCADRRLLIEHYLKRVAIVESKGYSNAMGYEPGTHGRRERVDDLACATWRSAFPNIDIRHDSNLSPSRWRKDQFRDQRYTKGWVEGDSVPGWGVTAGRFPEFLADVVRGEVVA